MGLAAAIGPWDENGAAHRCLGRRKMIVLALYHMRLVLLLRLMFIMRTIARWPSCHCSKRMGKDKTAHDKTALER